MAAVDREAEEQIAIDRTDTEVILIIGVTIVTLHDDPHVGRVAMIGDSYVALCLIHCLEPCTPVTLATAVVRFGLFS